MLWVTRSIGCPSQGRPFAVMPVESRYIRYDAAGISEADYRYGYGEALRDGIVRPVYFVSFGGEMEWVKDGEVKRAGYAEAVPRDEAAARLRTALDPAGGWMEHTL